MAIRRHTVCMRKQQRNQSSLSNSSVKRCRADDKHTRGAASHTRAMLQDTAGFPSQDCQQTQKAQNKMSPNTSVPKQRIICKFRYVIGPDCTEDKDKDSFQTAKRYCSSGQRPQLVMNSRTNSQFTSPHPTRQNCFVASRGRCEVGIRRTHVLLLNYWTK